MSTTDENPDRDESLQMFAGIDRVYVASLYISICALSITLHLLFITGIWKLCGWKSNFSFTLLLITSALCILRFLTELIASVTALFYLRWTRYLILWRCLGSFCLASDFTVLIVNIAMTFHRFIYTVVPFTASNYLTKSVLKFLASSYLPASVPIRQLWIVRAMSSLPCTASFLSLLQRFSTLF
ncbi:hypothetical protein Y032_0001g205 [Ancylostoma ceylanicum]|uniref:G-protein coupled receptors family 1 profile domain-containing protein n=1 Tax=Ancylostoma ceylanicum TaxID=53326 RepID=A0A016W391_9BILA|nr:hypothetical protein Y032_0001g205 [Ancylostoma ceylanicum]